MNFYFILFNLALMLKFSSCELFTASAEMGKLLTTQKVLMDALKAYIVVTENKLKKLKEHFQNFKKEQEKANENIEEYLGNPINDFLLIKRLTLDWREVENLGRKYHNVVEDPHWLRGIRLQCDYNDSSGRVLQSTPSALLKAQIYFLLKYFIEIIKKTTTNESIIFPTDVDLQGAAVAIPRLQIVYNLDTSSVANGEINNKRYDINLTAKDCFQLAKQLYKARDYHFTKLWLQEALIRYDDEVNKTVKKSDILQYLAPISRVTRDYVRIPKIVKELSNSLSVEEKLELNFTDFKEKLLQVKNSSRKGDDGPYSNFYGDFANLFIDIGNKYKKLCRDETGVREDIKVKLKCRYTDFGKPFLKLAKLKEEDVFLKPKVLLYHDVISDDEIEIVKQLAMMSMKRAVVFDDYDLVEASYRIGKASFLDDHLHPKLAKLSKRVEDITGLTTATAEPLQVVNYGIGGQYETHTDYLELREKERYDPERNYSERIATVLFYMNDVELGGATVFPCLNVSVFPKKGTALIWYNLRLSGDYELRSLHASCPVLKGFKWICNKWLGEQGQALFRPCGLTKDAQ